MHGLWLRDIESLEAISQDDGARDLFLRMAELSQLGRIPLFLHELQQDGELDDDTKATLTELAGDASFLQAIEDYVRWTQVLH